VLNNAITYYINCIFCSGMNKEITIEDEVPADESYRGHQRIEKMD
jgi:hypothetical protein